MRFIDCHLEIFLVNSALVGLWFTSRVCAQLARANKQRYWLASHLSTIHSSAVSSSASHMNTHVAPKDDLLTDSYCLYLCMWAGLPWGVRVCVSWIISFAEYWLVDSDHCVSEFHTHIWLLLLGMKIMNHRFLVTRMACENATHKWSTVKGYIHLYSFEGHILSQTGITIVWWRWTANSVLSADRNTA